MLTEAVAASTSMSGVLRHLDLRVSGGSHAHLRRRITQLGIDTSHFVGRVHVPGTRNPRRRGPDQILIERPLDAKRQAPTVLRRALEDLDRPYRCTECGIDGSWNGRPLTLQVDHIDGRFWNCRAENLRFLCPNCHSQTANYAGRNRPRRRVPVVRVDDLGSPVEQPVRCATTDEERAEVLQKVRRKEMTVADAARQLGCERRQVYALMRRWETRGTLEPLRGKPTTPDQPRAAIEDRSAVSETPRSGPTDYTLHNALP
ncbi:HNH endonuclease signature motif containing protein [Actinoplanes flavus]|uniref:Helix-turn-helix domain-containing protein n=1 Tax=Actinoplanes flavus TaxID=2820290 RepID=A0ABS3ULP6_9ACTN|nr:HNH endonuclease signature motif containing protein [Actinoplanes flavus]MBO3739700.1 helix-turn-helix domain-containing protein [Actinoplanes flavus]